MDRQVVSREGPRPDPMIYIIGNGVIAKALAVALSVHGKPVTILRGSVDGLAVSHERMEVDVPSERQEATIKISSISNYDQLDGIVLLTNKSFGNDQLAAKLQDKARNLPIVFLQNGLHIENSFIDRGFSNLYRCVLLATSESTGQNKVRLKLVAPSPIGLVNGSTDTLHYLVNQLNTTRFPFRTEPAIQILIWKKVISNCVFNSICPLLETDNGIFGRNPAVLEIGKSVIRECLRVAWHYDIHLTEDEVLQNVLMISRLSDGQTISTYQDILNKRQTEIDSLNFAIAEAARQKGNDALPITTLLGELTKLKSDLSRRDER